MARIETFQFAREKAVASHLRHLRQAIADCRAASPTSSLYMLIDRGMAPQVRRYASRALAGFSHEVLFAGTPEAGFADEYSPWLVAVPADVAGAWAEGARSEIAQKLCELAQEYACVSWLWSPVALGPLTAHLRAYLSGCLRNEHEDVDEGEVFLRYFDARVLPGFIQVLTAEQRNHFLQPIQRWGLWDRSLAWRSWDGGSTSVPDPIPTRLLSYTLAQQHALARHSQPDRLLSRLADDHAVAEYGEYSVGGQLLALPPDARYRRMRHLIEIGGLLGLCSDPDLVLHAVVACCMHPSYHEHPQIARALRERMLGGGKFADVIACVDDKYWDALAADRSSGDWPMESTRSAT